MCLLLGKTTGVSDNLYDAVKHASNGIPIDAKPNFKRAADMLISDNQIYLIILMSTDLTNRVLRSSE